MSTIEMKSFISTENRALQGNKHSSPASLAPPRVPSHEYVFGVGLIDS